ncbi:phage tail protein I [Sphingobium cupriresistens]|uniref:Tail protein n=1 Tax=Sphingobium cupriresistens LL01 TaxID=1420583 RepID=A0A0J7Y5C0_9SPHN|nr:phage tail protein I [Sphingobium cupriresistens]KMS58578.1 tail protein [Sphingobium cupriresistens LL01]
MTYPTLLPSGSTPLQKALEQTAAGLLDIDVPLRDEWSPENCPIEDLPWLVWGLSIDIWKSSWSEQQKRDAAADAIASQRSKGTRASLRTVLDRFDQLIEIVEWHQDRETLDPFSFRLELPLLAQSDVFYDEALVGEIMRDIAQVKPARAHMLAVYRVRAEAQAWLVSAAQAGGLARLDSLADQTSALDPVWDSFLQTRDGEPILAREGDYLVVNPGPLNRTAIQRVERVA